MSQQLLTNSRREAFQVCRKKHYYAYELGVRPIDDAKALRMGTAGHAGVETLGRGGSLAEACDAVRSHYNDMPTYYDQYEWDVELETVLRLVCAYDWRWGQHKLIYHSVEQVFQLPLLNPQSGKRTSSFDLGGKIDGIVEMEDGRLAVKESKFLGEDIGPDAPLWRRMKMDQQVSLYVIAARRLGYDIDTVLYDVVRKPSIRPEQVPVLDALGCRIVLDEHGNRVTTQRGQFRQTGDKEKGYVLQQRQQTATEWGDKLTADIGERPEFYFARVEIPRLENELLEHEYELWDVQQTIRDAQRNDRWYRTVNRNTCPYCSYFAFCSSGINPDAGLPDGFEKVYDQHPELQRENLDVISITPSPATC
jgi:hypothetical protein